MPNGDLQSLDLKTPNNTLVFRTTHKSYYSISHIRLNCACRATTRRTPDETLHSPVTVINYREMKTFLRSLTRPASASALVALALATLLYGDTISLPLFSDDLLQIPWLESISWRELWTSPSPYHYYRPLWYTLWRLWGGLVGGLHPPGLHLLNIGTHFIASWFTGLLAAVWVQPTSTKLDADEHRLSQIQKKSRVHLRSSVSYDQNTLVACIAATLFAVFPFSRQAIAWPGAVYNPLVSAMAAGALLAYDRGRREGARTRWIGLALLLAALAPITYEAGLLVGILILLTEGLGWVSQRWPRRSFSWRWPLAFGALLLITLMLWRAMRGAGVTGFGLNLADLRQNASYLVQGLIYPAAPLAQLLAEWRGLDPELCLWLIALPTLILLAWSGIRWNHTTFWLGAIWFALFALPPVVSMEADWFALAPRYLYMTAGGVALMWTTAIGGWLMRQRPSWRPLMAGILLLLLSLPAASFVRDGLRLYEMVGASIWEAANIATRQRPLLLVNMPMRITPHNRVYPVGFEGITPLPKRVTAEGLVYVHTGIHDAAENIAFGVVAADEPPDYTYQLFGPESGWEELVTAVRQGRTIYLTRYESDRISLVEAGAASEPPPGKPLAHFGERVTLLDASATCDQAGRVHLTAYWRVEAKVETDATVFAHLLGPDGAIVTQVDGYPLLQMLPFWQLNPGETVRDLRHFGPTPAGDYTIRLGMWDLVTGDPWPASEHLDGVVLLPVYCP
ncbi:MAG: hypothetical protein GY832_40315 [Chloroflexi bacterium]|nr:hypothetical protein [Chloroflexota bacterium]